MEYMEPVIIILVLVLVHWYAIDSIWFNARLASKIVKASWACTWNVLFWDWIFTGRASNEWLDILVL